MMKHLVSLFAFLVFGPRFNITAASNAPGNKGARLWDESTQGSDHTAMPGQPPLIPGGPENVLFAPVGTLVVDESGTLWQKTTDKSLATGWETVTTTPAIL